MKKLLDKKIDVKKLNISELGSLSEEVRDFLISSISKTGGHIGANLGVVELTIALHYVFNIEEDKLLFDVGHQGYTHKILTGRKNLFSSLNTIGGMSRFISPDESKYDILDASHGGTAISIGSGMAYANKLDNNNKLIVSIVGDGSFVEGMSFEGLNYASNERLPFIIVINDNGMSIPKNVGAVNNILKNENTASNFFEAMGYSYIHISDGHNIELTIKKFEEAREKVLNNTVVVHVKTQKGKGLKIADNHPYKLHFSMPFNPEDEKSTSPIPSGKAYTQIIAEELDILLKNDKNIFAITPSTPYASGLDNLLNLYPTQVLDVGMAEQHAAGMASGLLMQNKKVFLCYQSTFMQRAMDQLFHDICFMNLPVTIIASRSGFAGFDSPTHHGIYDLSYLRALPNLEVVYVGNSVDLKKLIQKRAKEAIKPLVVLHPYEAIRENEKDFVIENEDIEDDILYEGKDAYIFTIGNKIETAIELREKLISEGKDIGIINIKWLSPINHELIIQKLKKVSFAISLEENIKKAGFGSAISEIIIDNQLNTKLYRVAIENDFTKTGDKNYLSKLEKIDVNSIFERIKEFLKK